MDIRSDFTTLDVNVYTDSRRLCTQNQRLSIQILDEGMGDDPENLKACCKAGPARAF